MFETWEHDWCYCKNIVTSLCYLSKKKLIKFTHNRIEFQVQFFSLHRSIQWNISHPTVHRTVIFFFFIFTQLAKKNMKRERMRKSRNFYYVCIWAGIFKGRARNERSSIAVFLFTFILHILSLLWIYIIIWREIFTYKWNALESCSQRTL